MKRYLIIILALLLLVGCSKAEPAQSHPQELIAMWRSADPGELEMVETIEFREDGTVTVSCTYQGDDVGTISGTWAVENGVIACHIAQGTEPYSVTYAYAVDGRELTLEDDDGPAHYLRVS